MVAAGIAIRRRASDERGFTMMYALGVMVVVSLLLAAVFAAVQGDASLSRGDLDAKRAYSAAQAGAQNYLGQLNANASNSSWWQTCANDSTTSPVSVPGQALESYSYSPVITCTSSAQFASSVQTTGVLRMEFTGRAGNYGEQRTIVADFRPVTPLSYLWYTVHETRDPALNSACGKGALASNDSSFYSGDTYNGSSSVPPQSCWIYWADGDSVNGPMYTQDQFLVASGTTPSFGRPGGSDTIASHASASSVCVVNNGASAQPTTQACPNGVVQGTAQPSAPLVPLPSDNSNLAADASAHGYLLGAGTTTITLKRDPTGTTSDTYAIGFTCPDSLVTHCSVVNVDVTTHPVLYAPNATGCTPGAGSTGYLNVLSGGGYYGACGDVYVSGTYTSSLTIAAANSLIVTGNLLNSTDSSGNVAPTGTATLGLVANQYVRVMHVANTVPANRTIDAAILTLAHSFVVDNYDSGSGQGTLTIHGAIAQKYRGAVATSGSSGYIKNYNYDDRLRVILPAYLFDLQNTSWDAVRETLCGQNLPTSNAKSCSYAGS